MSSEGDEAAASAFAFQSFMVCLADAEQAGYMSNVAPPRRVHSSDLYANSGPRAVAIAERRRRERVALTTSSSGLDAVADHCS